METHIYIPAEIRSKRAKERSADTKNKPFVQYLAYYLCILFANFRNFHVLKSILYRFYKGSRAYGKKFLYQKSFFRYVD